MKTAHRNTRTDRIYRFYMEQKLKCKNNRGYSIHYFESHYRKTICLLLIQKNFNKLFTHIAVIITIIVVSLMTFPETELR